MSEISSADQAAINQRRYGWDQGAPMAYSPFSDPVVSQGWQGMNGLPSALSIGAGYANALSSANMQAAFGPESQVAIANIGLQQEALRQNAINQRIGPLLQLLAGAFGGLKGGASGFSGFQSNFGQGASAPGAPAGPGIK